MYIVTAAARVSGKTIKAEGEGLTPSQATDACIANLKAKLGTRIAIHITVDSKIARCDETQEGA